MAIQIIGRSGVTAEVDGSVYRALRVTIRPVDYGLRGAYRLSVATGTINATLTNGSLFQFYWPSYIAIALVWGVIVDYSGSSTVENYQTFKLMLERYVTAYGTGGSLITVPGTTGESQQLRTSMRASLANPVRVATTVALGNGTWREDPQAIGSLIFNVDSDGINRNSVRQLKLFGNLNNRMAFPIVLSAAEALNITLTTTTTPIFVVGSAIAWSEVAAY